MCGSTHSPRGVDAAASLDCVNHRVRQRNDIVGALDNIFEGIAHGETPALHQTRGVSVAINVADCGDGEVAGKATDAVEEVLVNPVAIGMLADGARGR